jgi:hypothetical protein
VTIAFTIFAFSYKLKIFQKLSVVFGYILVFFFILYPGYSDKIAHIFSIKNGTDLILYIVVSLSVLVSIILYVGQKNTNRIITKIIRENAKKYAKKC